MEWQTEQRQLWNAVCCGLTSPRWTSTRCWLLDGPQEPRHMAKWAGSPKCGCVLLPEHGGSFHLRLCVYPAISGLGSLRSEVAGSLTTETIEGRTRPADNTLDERKSGCSWLPLLRGTRATFAM